MEKLQPLPLGEGSSQGIRPPPPSQCCTDMGVSPYECVLLAAHGYHGCAAGASANLGLVLGPDIHLVWPPIVDDVWLPVATKKKTGPQGVCELHEMDVWPGCHNELVPVEPARQEDELYREVWRSMGLAFCWHRRVFL